jgi:hypothetical protein
MTAERQSNQQFAGDGHLRVAVAIYHSKFVAACPKVAARLACR